MASGNVVELAGYTTIFCDAEYETMNIDVNKLESLISEKTKAIMVVHLYFTVHLMD